MTTLKNTWKILNLKSRLIIQRSLHSPRMLQETKSSKLQKTTKVRPDAKVPRLIDKEVAQDIARTLKPYLTQKPIFECYPGEGLLSEALLDEGVQNLILWESQDKYWPRLQALEEQNNNIKLEKKTFFHRKVHGQFESDYMQPKSRIWNEAIQIQVVATGHPKYLGLWLSRYTYAMTSGSFPHHQGRAKLFIIVSGREQQLMTNKDEALGGMPGPIPLRIHDYQLFYEVKTLLKIPKYALDGEVDYRSKVPKTATWDQENYYVMEVTPRPDLFTAICEKEMLGIFIAFNHQMYRVRKSNLVQRLEHWCPGLGLVAIDMGYTMLDTVKHLQPQHLPIIFKEFQARGGVENLSLQDYTSEGIAPIVRDAGMVMMPSDDAVEMQFVTQALEDASAFAHEKHVKSTKVAKLKKRPSHVDDETMANLDSSLAHLPGSSDDVTIKKPRRSPKKTEKHEAIEVDINTYELNNPKPYSKANIESLPSLPEDIPARKIASKKYISSTVPHKKVSTTPQGEHDLIQSKQHFQETCSALREPQRSSCTETKDQGSSQVSYSPSNCIENKLNSKLIQEHKGSATQELDQYHNPSTKKGPQIIRSEPIGTVSASKQHSVDTETDGTSGGSAISQGVFPPLLNQYEPCIDDNSINGHLSESETRHAQPHMPIKIKSGALNDINQSETQILTSTHKQLKLNNEIKDMACDEVSMTNKMSNDSVMSSITTSNVNPCNKDQLKERSLMAEADQMPCRQGSDDTPTPMKCHDIYDSSKNSKPNNATINMPASENIKAVTVDTARSETKQIQPWWKRLLGL